MKIIDRTFEFLGHSFHFRFEPKEFEDDCKRIDMFINAGYFRQAQEEIDRVKPKWGHDIDFLALEVRKRWEEFKVNKGK